VHGSSHRKAVRCQARQDTDRGRHSWQPRSPTPSEGRRRNGCAARAFLAVDDATSWFSQPRSKPSRAPQRSSSRRTGASFADANAMNATTALLRRDSLSPALRQRSRASSSETLPARRRSTRSVRAPCGQACSADRWRGRSRSRRYSRSGSTIVARDAMRACQSARLARRRSACGGGVYAEVNSADSYHRLSSHLPCSFLPMWP
jgi:hypothetical protein